MNELEFYCVAALMQACVLVPAASQYGGSLVFEQVDRQADPEFPGLTRNPRLTSRAEQERLDVEAGVYMHGGRIGLLCRRATGNCLCPESCRAEASKSGEAKS
jgi:hypothetical protein